MLDALKSIADDQLSEYSVERTESGEVVQQIEDGSVLLQRTIEKKYQGQVAQQQAMSRTMSQFDTRYVGTVSGPSLDRRPSARTTRRVRLTYFNLPTPSGPASAGGSVRGTFNTNMLTKLVSYSDRYALVDIGKRHEIVWELLSKVDIYVGRELIPKKNQITTTPYVIPR